MKAERPEGKKLEERVLSTSSSDYSPDRTLVDVYGQVIENRGTEILASVWSASDPADHGKFLLPSQMFSWQPQEKDYFHYQVSLTSRLIQKKESEMPGTGRELTPDEIAAIEAMPSAYDFLIKMKSVQDRWFELYKKHEEVLMQTYPGEHVALSWDGKVLAHHKSFEELLKISGVGKIHPNTYEIFCVPFSKDPSHNLITPSSRMLD